MQGKRCTLPLDTRDVSNFLIVCSSIGFFVCLSVIEGKETLGFSRPSIFGEGGTPNFNDKK
ncbi:MAG: hypothetical protein BGO76_00505 [Caedibacter sp. 38-128]|nr:hypothetical protein [Holosporales bacterium]OJX02952.1 MAG: hypothetical protein BGO76_00505 [Caedibacter sp. 38-128]